MTETVTTWSVRAFAASTIVVLSLTPMCCWAAEAPIAPSIITAPAQATHRIAVAGGTLSFEGERLRDVLAEVNNRNHCQLILVDEANANLEVSGHLPISDLRAIIRRLQVALNVRIRMSDMGSPECGAMQMTLVPRTGAVRDKDAALYRFEPAGE